MCELYIHILHHFYAYYLSHLILHWYFLEYICRY